MLGFEGAKKWKVFDSAEKSRGFEAAKLLAHSDGERFRRRHRGVAQKHKNNLHKQNKQKHELEAKK